MQKPIV